MRKKLYLIGIDAVPLWMLKELSGEKGMEVVAKLLAAGNVSELESTLPPMTGPAWPSIYTGLTPAEHGVPDFFVMKENYTPDLVFYKPDQYPPFWEQLAVRGYRCLLITPATVIDLPSNSNIDIITGFPTRAKTNSQALQKLMKKYSFTGEPDIEKDIKDGKMTELQASKIFADSVEKRIGIAKDMMAKTNYDFVFVCFTETDRIHHFVLSKKNWKEYLLPIYTKIFSFVSELMQKVDEEDSKLLIVSDHGSQPISNKFLVNTWLIRNGYAELSHSMKESLKEGDKSNNEKSAPVAYSVREKLLKTKLRKVYDKLPYKAKTTVFNVLGQVSSKASAGEYSGLHLFDLDMTKTRVFAAISKNPVATLWINDSRFKKGIVKSSEKSALKQEVMKGLKDAKAQDGSNVLRHVFDGDEYYKSTKKFIYADIIIEAEDGYSLDPLSYARHTFFMPPEAAKSGDHSRQGIIAFHSRKAKKFSKNPDVMSIAPTILNYYGIKNPFSKNSILKDLVE